jgi:hypothetical protein
MDALRKGKQFGKLAQNAVPGTGDRELRLAAGSARW